MPLTIKPCPRCRADILTGLSGTRRAAVDVALDPAPLNPPAELGRLLAGCRTWTLHSGGQAHPRTAATIRARPAGTIPRQTVLADHRCSPGGNP